MAGSLGPRDGATKNEFFSLGAHTVGSLSRGVSRRAAGGVTWGLTSDVLMLLRASGPQRLLASCQRPEKHLGFDTPRCNFSHIFLLPAVSSNGGLGTAQVPHWYDTGYDTRCNTGHNTVLHMTSGTWNSAPQVLGVQILRTYVQYVQEHCWILSVIHSSHIQANRSPSPCLPCPWNNSIVLTQGLPSVLFWTLQPWSRQRLGMHQRHLL